jgi:hypothetical protein
MIVLVIPFAAILTRFLLLVRSGSKYWTGVPGITKKSGLLPRIGASSTLFKDGKTHYNKSERASGYSGSRQGRYGSTQYSSRACSWRDAWPKGDLFCR